MTSAIKRVFSIIKAWVFWNIYKPRLKKPLVWYRGSDNFLKSQHILEAINYIRITQLPLVFFEFGCCSGRTFSAALLSGEFFNLPLQGYAFDSFQGLPKTNSQEDGCFKTGSFAMSKKKFQKIVYAKTKKFLDDKYIVEGFYTETLKKV